MQIPILIEKHGDDGFLATTGGPLFIRAAGTTSEEAVARVRFLIADRFAAGARLVGLDVGSADHPLAPIPGWDEGDPLFDEWEEAKAEYRRRVEDDPNRL